MAEQTQIQQITTKDPKKVKQGKKLAEHNRRKREKRERLAKAQSESNITYYGAGAIVAIRVLGISVITFTNPRLLRGILLTNQKKPQFTSLSKL